MKFDFKVTTWERVTVPTELEEVVAKAIKEGEITSANGVYLYLTDNGNEPLVDDVISELIDGMETQMTVDENGGSSTIELIDDDGNPIWCNGE